MTRKVLFVELNVTRGVLPLVSGYLQAYACLDRELARTHTFARCAESLRTPRAELLDRLCAEDADVYAFSCYVWNMKLVRRLVEALREHRPRARILLGGPQVDGHGALYLAADAENVYVANGEGERVFRDFLLASAGSGDMSSVPGLTFRRDGALIDTPRAEPIERLEDIPSPFLSGIFDGAAYSSTVWETNRGCPYACTFCYWGKGDDRSVRKFDDERLRAELAWLGSKSVCYVHLGDANWGMFPRDVELSRELVRTKERFGAPLIITFSAAKAKIDRSSEIAALFHDAGIVSAQAIGIQSTSDEVLRAIRRRNIKLPLLMASSIEMERRGVSTFVEIIWPLPGETLTSFKTCITSLCRAEVTTIIIYPALLLHATPMEQQVEQYGIVTAPVDDEDEVSELQLVVATKDVSPEQHVDGIWLCFAVYCLYDARTLRHLGRYLDERGVLPWAELFDAFARFCRAGKSAAAEHWRRVVARGAPAEQQSLGELVHLVLHDQRHDFLRCVAEFVRMMPFWELEEVRALFELDLVNCPYVYANTEFVPVPESLLPLDFLSIVPTGGRCARVTVDPELLPVIGRALLGDHARPSGTFDVSYQHKQFPFMPGKSMRENFTYVYGMIHRASVITPRWTEVPVG